MTGPASKRKIDPQLLIAIGVMLISLSALVVSIRQSSIMNKQTEVLLQQTKSSAWPHLEVEMGKSMIEGGFSQ